MSGQVSVKVSVVTTSYNQEAYIAEALDSVLAQRCDFDFEYIVSDDASTDRTPQILADYQRRHPDRIRLVLRDRNVGAQLNLSGALELCDGEYVALLDGDDYWTSTHKLQKQAYFMDAHPDCALCFHDTMVIYPDGSPSTAPPARPRPERSEIEDLFRENFISACTVMYRWGLVQDLPPWWGDVWIGDFPLHVLHAQFGWIGHVDEVMAAYRLHGSGLWSGRTAAARIDGFVDSLRRLDKTLEHRYHDTIEKSVFANRFDVAGVLQESGERRLSRTYVLKCIAHMGRRGDVPARAVAALALKVFLPAAASALAKAMAFLRGSRARRP